MAASTWARCARRSQCWRGRRAQSRRAARNKVTRHIEKSQSATGGSPLEYRQEAEMTVITHVEDLRRLAQRRVPRMFYDYADSGSWTEGTYRANEADFRDIRLR